MCIFICLLYMYKERERERDLPNYRVVCLYDVHCTNMLLTPECIFQSLTPAVIRHQNASPLYWANWVVLHGLRFLAWVGACFVDIFCVRIYTCVYIYTDMTHISLSVYLPIYLIRLSIYLSTIYLSIDVSTLYLPGLFMANLEKL